MEIFFITIHTFNQCNESHNFNEMDGDVENCDVSGRNGSMNIQALYQHNGLKKLINSNNGDDIDINDDLKNGDASRRIDLINSHTLYQFNESSYFKEIGWDV